MSSSQGGLVVIPSPKAPDYGLRLKQGMGIVPMNFESSEVFAGLMDIDDSGSIRMAGNSQVMRDGVNLYLTALRESDARDDTIVCIKTINGDLIYPWGDLMNAPMLDAQNYNPNKGTPLLDSIVTSGDLLLTKAAEFTAGGATFRGCGAWVSDGAELHSQCSFDEAKRKIEELKKREIFILMFVGIDDGVTDFRSYALSLGFEKDLILTPGNTPSEIRKAFGTVSRASKVASQGAGGFSKVATGGGFGAVGG